MLRYNLLRGGIRRRPFCFRAVPAHKYMHTNAHVHTPMHTRRDRGKAVPPHHFGEVGKPQKVPNTCAPRVLSRKSRITSKTSQTNFSNRFRFCKKIKLWLSGNDSNTELPRSFRGEPSN